MADSNANVTPEIIEPVNRSERYRDHYHPMSNTVPGYPVGSDAEEFDRYFDILVSRICEINNAYADYCVNGGRSKGRYTQAVRSFNVMAHRVPNFGLKEFWVDKRGGFITGIRVVSGPLGDDPNPDYPGMSSCSSESYYDGYPTGH